jgi:hypothetical protein
MVSGARPNTRNDRLLGVAMTRLILGERLTDDFHPWDGGELLQHLMLSFPRLRAVHSHRDRQQRLQERAQAAEGGQRRAPWAISAENADLRSQGSRRYAPRLAALSGARAFDPVRVRGIDLS